MAPVNYDTQVMLMQRASFILANQPHIATLPSAPAQNFTTDLKAPLKECKVYFSPVQSGSGTPSPNNVRPITGWTSLTTYYSGENLYIPNENNKGYIKNNGTIVVDDHSTYTDLIPVVAGDIYSFKCTTVSINGSTNRRLHGYDSNGNWVSQLKVATTAKNTAENVNIMVTIPSGISYIRVSFRIGDVNPRVAKENAYEVDWSNDVGTVHGGYVDLVTGELFIDHGSVIYDGSENWSEYHNGGTSNLCFYRSINNKASGYNKSICNKFPNYNDTNLWDKEIYSVFSDHPTRDTIYFNAHAVLANGVADWKNWLAENPIQIVYELATPIAYQLSSAQLKTLRGTNNIWSNANGPVEVSYWTH